MLLNNPFLSILWLTIFYENFYFWNINLAVAERKSICFKLFVIFKKRRRLKLVRNVISIKNAYFLFHFMFCLICMFQYTSEILWMLQIYYTQEIYEMWIERHEFSKRNGDQPWINISSRNIIIFHYWYEYAQTYVWVENIEFLLVGLLLNRIYVYVLQRRLTIQSNIYLYGIKADSYDSNRHIKNSIVSANLIDIHFSHVCNQYHIALVRIKKNRKKINIIINAAV